MAKLRMASEHMAHEEMMHALVVHDKLHMYYGERGNVLSTRQSMRTYHLSGHLCGAIIYPAIFAGLSFILRSIRSYHLSCDLCGDIIYPAIYEEPLYFQRSLWAH